MFTCKGDLVGKYGRRLAGRFINGCVWHSESFLSLQIFSSVTTSSVFAKWCPRKSDNYPPKEIERGANSFDAYIKDVSYFHLFQRDGSTVLEKIISKVV